jgi:hypothetical protein
MTIVKDVNYVKDGRVCSDPYDEVKVLIAIDSL